MNSPAFQKKKKKNSWRVGKSNYLRRTSRIYRMIIFVVDFDFSFLSRLYLFLRVAYAWVVPWLLLAPDRRGFKVELELMDVHWSWSPAEFGCYFSWRSSRSEYCNGFLFVLTIYIVRIYLFFLLQIHPLILQIPSFKGL